MNRCNQGYLFGMVGVLVFSGSLPATRAAMGGFDPFFLTAARATIAAVISAVPLLLLREPMPRKNDLSFLAIVGACVVLGYPLLSALALGHISAARGLLLNGLLPLATAIFAIVRNRERPQRIFWLFSVAGAALVGCFALSTGHGRASVGDLLMLAAILVGGIGYTEGASLARRLGGWQVICWALLLAAPPMLLLGWATKPNTLAGIAPSAWIGLGYLSLFSTVIGFVFWYRGLALGGTARVSQLQLLQPLLGFGLASLLLHEPIGWPLLGTMMGVLICVLGARRFA